MARERSKGSVEGQRERALDAAFALFDAQGVEGVSLRAIANDVNLTAMALYRYFPGGKGEILATLRGRGFERLAAEFEVVAAAQPGAIERILDLTVALTRFAQRAPRLYRLMFDVTQAEEFEEYLATRRALAWRRPGGAFADAIHEGSLSGDPEQLPHLFFAAVHGLIAFELSDQPQPQRRLNRSLVPLLELLFRGAGAKPSVLRKVKALGASKPLDTSARARHRSKGAAT